jgi:hypothetical protein
MCRRCILCVILGPYASSSVTVGAYTLLRSNHRPCVRIVAVVFSPVLLLLASLPLLLLLLLVSPLHHLLALPVILLLISLLLAISPVLLIVVSPVVVVIVISCRYPPCRLTRSPPCRLTRSPPCRLTRSPSCHLACSPGWLASSCLPHHSSSSSVSPLPSASFSCYLSSSCSYFSSSSSSCSSLLSHLSSVSPLLLLIVSPPSSSSFPSSSSSCRPSESLRRDLVSSWWQGKRCQWGMGRRMAKMNHSTLHSPTEFRWTPLDSRWTSGVQPNYVGQCKDLPSCPPIPSENPAKCTQQRGSARRAMIDDVFYN